MFRVFWLAYWTFIILLFVVLLKGCASPPHAKTLPPLAQAKESTIDKVLERPLVDAVLSILAAAPHYEGQILEHWGTTTGRSRGGVNPYIWLPKTDRHPKVGEDVVLKFTTRALQPFPIEDIYLVVGTKMLDAPVDFTPYGMPGSQLLIDPEWIVRVPARQDVDGMVRHQAQTGEAVLRWTAPVWSAGMRFFIQIVTASPGETASGFLASHAVEVLVGS
jgi:hypothetical protein